MVAVRLIHCMTTGIQSVESNGLFGNHGNDGNNARWMHIQVFMYSECEYIYDLTGIQLFQVEDGMLSSKQTSMS